MIFTDHEFKINVNLISMANKKKRISKHGPKVEKTRLKKQIIQTFLIKCSIYECSINKTMEI